MASPTPNSSPSTASPPPQASTFSPPPEASSTASPPPHASTSNSPASPPPHASTSNSPASPPPSALTTTPSPSSPSMTVTPTETPKPNTTADPPAPSTATPTTPSTPPPQTSAANPVASPPASVSTPPSKRTPTLSPPPPVLSPPPSPILAPPPAVVPSPPPPALSPPPPSTSSPPSDSPVPPVSSSPPPPVDATPPPSSNSPPPPLAKPPENSPPPPSHTSPPPSSSHPAPAPSSPLSPPPPPPPRHLTGAPPSSSPPKSASSPPAASPSPVILTPPSSSNATPPVTAPRSSSAATPPATTPTSNVGKIPPSPSPPSLEVPTPATTSLRPNATTNHNSTSSGGGHSVPTVAIAVVVSFVVLGLVVFGVCLWRKRKRKATIGGYVMPSPYNSSPQSDSSFFKTPHSSAPLVGSGSISNFMRSPSDSGGLGNSKSYFSYEELAEITNGFSLQNLLGEGGFGSVYKGCLPDGREVAVKQLKVGGAQGEREFRAEVEIISRVHHRHLVSLVGYCIAEHQRLLVYDYVPNNNLYYHLHEEGRPVMDWATRIKVAAGAARGLAYLHEDCHPRIIHRDIKSSNILLDNHFEAQVSDFGLAKLALDTNTHISTRVMGTFGYMAPEYASSGKLTEKSDVYSFGVVLLELITGRKPVDASQPLGDESLVEWARPLLSQVLDCQDFQGLADPRLENNYVGHEMFRMIEAAAACVRHSAVKRPRMGQVVRALDCVGDSADLTNGMRPGNSEVFNSAQQSAEIRMFQRMAFGSQDYNSSFFSENSWRSREYRRSQEHGAAQEDGRSREYAL
ncbi:hypothetical protein NE237_020195 [Protea cynaroides]|uniref:non-specific serine/threonine protein kinase n=1 Tax=Protea cynaroides TaxID=273540 RepID=A0A9Q0H6S3_9MAGN|nr:hypothetical protein NE237_020195 [Protea cynaroides]